MTKIAFKSSEDGINQLPEIMERLHTIFLRSHSDYDIYISIAVSKITSKCHKKMLSDSSTSSLTTSPIEIRIPKRKDRRNNETQSPTGTSSVVQQTSGGYVDLAKLKNSEQENYEKVSKSLISNRPHRK